VFGVEFTDRQTAASPLPHEPPPATFFALGRAEHSLCHGQVIPDAWSGSSLPCSAKCGWPDGSHFQRATWVRSMERSVSGGSGECCAPAEDDRSRVEDKDHRREPCPFRCTAPAKFCEARGAFAAFDDVRLDEPKAIHGLRAAAVHLRLRQEPSVLL
jgi:hypothetical protein